MKIKIRERHLVATGVQRRFKNEDGTELVALKDFELEVDHGELVALIGSSGCGKSTFLRLVAGLDKPEGGTITYNGQQSKAPIRTAASCSSRRTSTPG